MLATAREVKCSDCGIESQQSERCWVCGKSREVTISRQFYGFNMQTETPHYSPDPEDATFLAAISVNSTVWEEREVDCPKYGPCTIIKAIGRVNHGAVIGTRVFSRVDHW